MTPGSRDQVAHKFSTTARPLGLDRFDLKYASGPTPHEDLMTSIDLYGRKVIPRVRELLDEAGYRPGEPQTVSRLSNLRTRGCAPGPPRRPNVRPAPGRDHRERSRLR